MCQTGDIILIKDYSRHGKELNRHSFVVISDEEGKIRGLNYDLICNVMSSFKNDEQRKKKLSYPGNFQITHTDTMVEHGNDADGYIKAEQFYYFNKDEIDFMVIGYINKDVFESLLRFIETLNIDIENIIDNL